MARPADRTAVWEKPGPGTWILDSSHCGPAPSSMQRHIFSATLPAGFGDGFDLFGSPLKKIDIAWVNGKFYRRLVPLVGGGADMPPPPAFVLKLVARIHPAFRRAERRAAHSLSTKLWRSEIVRWEEEWKPALIARNLELTDLDVTSLGDDDLADHIDELHALVLDSTRLHFRLHVSDMGPLGNLMVHLERWGLRQADAFRALVKASPATRAPAEELRLLADEVRASGVDPTTVASLDEVRGASEQASALLDEYLRFHGWRLTTGYELEDRCLIEMPDVVLACIRAAATRTNENPTDAAELALEALRDEVPEQHRAEFDELAEDARLSYGLRDENGPVTYEWPAGLLRRALLEAGRHLATAGHLAGAGDLFELSIEEVTGFLRAGEGPALDEIAERADERRWWASLDPPERLGPEEADPPVDALPENLATFTRIVLAVTATLEAEGGTAPLSGLGIGSETFTGTARVVHDAAEALQRVEPGDIIVAPYTAPTYNAVLAMAGGLITEEGGLLCHAAVIARELGLPAVIGAADAMRSIPDGAIVEIDPVAGVARVVDTQPAPA